jgi:hypothetical protein
LREIQNPSSECRIRRITNRHFVGSPSKIPTPPFNPSMILFLQILIRFTNKRQIETFIVPDSGIQPINVISNLANSLVRQNLDRLKCLISAIIFFLFLVV